MRWSDGLITRFKKIELNQKMTYCENRLEQIRAKEFQGIPLTEEDIKTRAMMKELLKSYHLEWEELSS